MVEIGPNGWGKSGGGIFEKIISINGFDPFYYHLKILLSAPKGVFDNISVNFSFCFRCSLKLAAIVCYAMN